MELFDIPESVAVSLVWLTQKRETTNRNKSNTIDQFLSLRSYKNELNQSDYPKIQWLNRCREIDAIV